jgi:hypothetical protein
MQPTHRSRRRKRTRPQVVEDNIISRPQQKSVLSLVPSLDDSSLTFLDSSGDALADRQAVQSCLPTLLEERRLGVWSCRRNQQLRWQSRALSTFTKKPFQENASRRQWRPLSKRSIPFTQLGTPRTDAVLAVERRGSYILSLGTKDDRSNVPLALALRFYGTSLERIFESSSNPARCVFYSTN